MSARQEVTRVKLLDELIIAKPDGTNGGILLQKK
jgi:hypothetical protein